MLLIQELVLSLEIKKKNEGNTQSGTENLVHMYKDVALNEGDNTVALKIEKNKGYKLFP